MAEAGFPEVNTKLWSGYFAALNTPPRDRRQARGRVAQGDHRSGRERQAQGAWRSRRAATSSADFRKMIDDDIKSYADVIKAANLKFDN